MTHDIETDLRDRLHEATHGLCASAGLWAEAERRGRRRLLRRRVGIGAGTAGIAGALVGLAMLLPPTLAAPTIEPAAPQGTASEQDSEAQQQDEGAEAGRARAEEQRDRAALEAEQARQEALRDALEARRAGLEDLAPVEPLPPITGYGDFSNVSFFELDTYAVAERVAACLLDAGFGVELAAPGDVIGFDEVDPGRLELAQATAAACRAGMNLPEQSLPTLEQRDIAFSYQLAVHQCLTQAGLEPPPPPSRTSGSWSPYDRLAIPGGPLADPADFEAMQMHCPQRPVGGFATWTPGDPIRPVEGPQPGGR